MTTRTQADIFMHIHTEKPEEALTEAELRLLAHAMYKRCGIYIFAFLRAYELGGYRPAIREAEYAYQKLCALLVCEDFVIQILQYFIGNEKQRLVRASAESDPQFIKASEALRGVTSAPLMAELPTKAAYMLWVLAGSWVGALALCGIKPMERNNRRYSLKRYRLSHASINLLPAQIHRALPPACLAVADRLCAQARESGKAPDVTPDDQNIFLAAGFRLEEVMAEVGVTMISGQEKSRRQSVERWKKQSTWWRGSPEYRAMTGRSHAENQQLKRERKLQKGAAQAQT